MLVFNSRAALLSMNFYMLLNGRVMQMLK